MREGVLSYLDVVFLWWRQRNRGAGDLMPSKSKLRAQGLRLRRCTVVGEWARGQICREFWTCSLMSTAAFCLCLTVE